MKIKKLALLSAATVLLSGCGEVSSFKKEASPVTYDSFMNILEAVAEQNSFFLYDDKTMLTYSFESNSKSSSSTEVVYKSPIDSKVLYKETTKTNSESNTKLDAINNVYYQDSVSTTTISEPDLSSTEKTKTKTQTQANYDSMQTIDMLSKTYTSVKNLKPGDTIRAFEKSFLRGFISSSSDFFMKDASYFIDSNVYTVNYSKQTTGNPAKIENNKFQLVVNADSMVLNTKKVTTTSSIDKMLVTTITTEESSSKITRKGLVINKVDTSKYLDLTPKSTDIIPDIDLDDLDDYGFDESIGELENLDIDMSELEKYLEELENLQF